MSKFERLTKKDVSAQGIYKTCCVNFHNAECKILQGDCTMCSTEDKAWDRLAQYENIGLFPEEIKNLLHDGGIGMAIRHRKEREEFAELAKAKAEGRLIELPCKLGDTVYCPQYINQCVMSGKVVLVFRNAYDTFLDIQDEHGKGTKYAEREWKTHVFLTREEAEAALKGGDQDGT